MKQMHPFRLDFLSSFVSSFYPWNFHLPLEFLQKLKGEIYLNSSDLCDSLSSRTEFQEF